MPTMRSEIISKTVREDSSIYVHERHIHSNGRVVDVVYDILDEGDIDARIEAELKIRAAKIEKFLSRLGIGYGGVTSLTFYGFPGDN